MTKFERRTLLKKLIKNFIEMGYQYQRAEAMAQERVMVDSIYYNVALRAKAIEAYILSGQIPIN
jgi:hypothetical protein